MKKNRGAALIPALLIVALATTLAAGLMSRLDSALQAAIWRQDEIAARHLLMASLDYARAVLWEDARVSLIDAPNEIWASEAGALPLEGGRVSGRIRDAQGFFNLNDVLIEGAVSEEDVAAFDRLAASAGFDCLRGARLAAALRAGPLNDVAELGTRAGIDAQCLARLRDVAVALPTRAAINVNTASAQVLAAYLPGAGVATVEAALGANRPVFSSVADFGKRLGLAGAQLQRFAVATRYFQVSGEAQNGRATVSASALIERDGRRWPRLIFVRIS